MEHISEHISEERFRLTDVEMPPVRLSKTVKSTDPLKIPEPRYPHFQPLEVKMLKYVLHGMATGAKFPRSELVAFVRNRTTETAFTSPTRRLTSSRFKLYVVSSANLLLICVPHMKISNLLI